MTHNTLTHHAELDIQTAFPLLRLLNPKQYTRIVLLSLAIGLVVSYSAVALGWLPLWGATAMTLLILLPAGVLKWRDDRLRYGTTIMILSILLTAQGLHTVEHLVQWAQYHLLYLDHAPIQRAALAGQRRVGALHVELAGADRGGRADGGGMRNGWMWVLLAVAAFHTIEHSYTFIRYQMILRELTRAWTCST